LDERGELAWVSESGGKKKRHKEKWATKCRKQNTQKSGRKENEMNQITQSAR